VIGQQNGDRPAVQLDSISDFALHAYSLLNLVAFEAYMLFTRIC
jgi:hypothetical protein